MCNPELLAIFLSLCSSINIQQDVPSGECVKAYDVCYERTQEQYPEEDRDFILDVCDDDINHRQLLFEYSSGVACEEVSRKNRLKLQYYNI